MNKRSHILKLKFRTEEDKQDFADQVRMDIAHMGNECPIIEVVLNGTN